MPFISTFLQRRGQRLERLSHLSVIYRGGKCRHCFKATCPCVQVNKVALRNIWLYLTFRPCFKDCSQMENIWGPGGIDWTCRGNFCWENMSTWCVPSSFTPLLFRPWREVTEYEGYRDWFGSKDQSFRNRNVFVWGFQVRFTRQRTNCTIRFSPQSWPRWEPLLESEIFSLGETFFRLAL